MPSPIRIYRFINLLSLDVVAGAIIGSLFFARVLGVEVRPFGLIALGLTVWIIYTADHLRDAKMIAGSASTERHRFHQMYYSRLSALTVVALCLDVIAILFIKQQVFQWGVALSLIVFAYLFIHSSLKYLKEIAIAVLYTCGVLLLSIPVTTIKLDTPHYLLVIQFFLAALANLIMFSWFDRELDERDKRYSFVTKAGDANTRRVVWLLLLALLILSFIQCIIGSLIVPGLILGCMGLVLSLIFFYRNSFSKQDYYRLFGDAVFFIPASYLFLTT
jgi:4-hydroxybenzoate polyprenyltransferase